MTKKALVVVFSNLKHDARVNRQINFLRKHFQVTVAAFDGDDAPGLTLMKIDQTPLTLITKIQMAFWFGLRIYRKAYYVFHSYKTIARQLSKHSWDLIIANDVDTLPMVYSIKGDSVAKVIFDAHEFAPRHFENRLLWKIFIQPFYIYLCKKYIPLVDVMLTVGKGLANEYKKNFGKTPVIITNATNYSDVRPSLITSGKVKLVYHGIVNPSRRLELLLELMQHLDDRFTLDLFLLTSDFASGSTKAYLEKLKVKFLSNSRISILPAVKSNEVVNSISKYDMGLFLLPPINFNYENTLPNKLFDFIQARIAIGIGPSPEMAPIVKQYNLGVVSSSFDPKELAALLMTLTQDQIMEFKRNADVAARELNAEKNEEIMQGIINNMFA